MNQVYICMAELRNRVSGEPPSFHGILDTKSARFLGPFRIIGSLACELPRRMLGPGKSIKREDDFHACH